MGCMQIKIGFLPILRNKYFKTANAMQFFIGMHDSVFQALVTNVWAVLHVHTCKKDTTYLQ